MRLSPPLLFLFLAPLTDSLPSLHRRVLSRYAGQDVQFHFATILSPWIKRALLAGGFGRDGDYNPVEVAGVTNQEGNADGLSVRPPLAQQVSAQDIKERESDDIESGRSVDDKVPYGESYAGSIVEGSFPGFHLDLPSAVEAAVRN